MGKLWHSFNGLYDLIHTDLYSISYHSKPSLSVINYSFDDPHHVSVYSEVKTLAFNSFSESDLATRYSNWYIRTLFSECMHFSSLFSFHLDKSPMNGRAVILYARAVELCNYFIHEFDLKSYSSDTYFLRQFNLSHLTEFLNR